VLFLPTLHFLLLGQKGPAHTGKGGEGELIFAPLVNSKGEGRGELTSERKKGRGRPPTHPFFSVTRGKKRSHAMAADLLRRGEGEPSFLFESVDMEKEAVANARGEKGKERVVFPPYLSKGKGKSRSVVAKKGKGKSIPSHS